MEIFAVILGLLILATFFLPWINFFAIRRLQEDIERIQSAQPWRDPSDYAITQEEEIENPHPHGTKTPIIEAVTSPPPIIKEEVREAIIRRRAIPRVEELTSEATFKSRVSLEQNIGTKISVWLGSIALIFAAFYLVKYSIDQGFLSPAVRLSLSSAFGISLICAGQWLCNRKHIANATRISQGLIGAGVVTLYVVLYAALNLYHLIPAGLAFAGMAAVTATAVVMSLRHGQAIAIFGIFGGLLTPMMVGSDSPNAPLLFSYLFILYAGIISILVRKGWWVLAAITLIGFLLWPLFWLATAFLPSDSLTLTVFACLVCAVSLLVASKKLQAEDRDPAFHGFNMLAVVGTALIVAWLGMKVEMDVFDWAMLELISLAVIVLTYFKPDIYKTILCGKLALDLALLMVWIGGADSHSIIVALSYMVGVYVVLPSWTMLRSAQPSLWAAIQIIFAIGSFLICYLQLKDQMLSPYHWGGIGFGLSIFFIGLTQRTIRHFRNDTLETDIMVAVYASAASFFISMGLAIVLPSQYLPLAFAGQILATALIYKAVRVEFLKPVMIALTVIYLALNYKYVLTFGGTILASLSDTIHRGSVSLMEDTAIKLLLPALLIGAGYAVLKRESESWRYSKPLFVVAAISAMAYFYILIRDFFYVDFSAFNIMAGFIERNVITFAIFLVPALVFYYLGRIGKFNANNFVRILVFTALARLIYFDLLLHNPYWDGSQFIGDTFLLNGGTFAYGMGIFVCFFIAKKCLHEDYLLPKSILQVLALAFLFSLASITVTQGFRGGFLTQKMMTDMELYTYSIVWLLTGIALLAAGIAKGNKLARLASLCFILLTVVKVFLIDASELKDLYRVFSFLGLGASLIGLSFFYSRYVFKTKPK